jgi:DNA ligase-1
LVAQIDSPRIVSVPHVQIDNDKDLVSYFAKCTSEGFEGIMIKDPKARYEFKRSRNVLKLKPVMTTEFVVTGWYEGRDNSKREGLFGGFYGIASNGVITRLGGGYKDTMLAEIQLNGPGSYVGMVAECEGQPDVTTEDGLTEDGKLRFPVWCRWRDHSDVDQSLIEAYNNYCETNSTANE